MHISCLERVITAGAFFSALKWLVSICRDLRVALRHVLNVRSLPTVAAELLSRLARSERQLHVCTSPETYAGLSPGTPLILSLDSKCRYIVT